MGEMFLEKQYEIILAKCNKFKNRYLKINDMRGEKVLVQLSYELEDLDNLKVSFDVYTLNLLHRINDFSGNPDGCKMPLFSCHFDMLISKNDFKYKEIKVAAKNNNGWLDAKICDNTDKDCTFYGQLVCECGDVKHINVGIKMQYGLGEDVKGIVDRATAGVESIISSRIVNLNHREGEEEIGEATSYDVRLYKVGDANTSFIINSRTQESLLVDCGIERKLQYRNVYSAAENEIKLLNPEYILLSHNHKDHYNILYVSASAQSISLGLQNTVALKRVIITDTHSGSLNLLIVQALLMSRLKYINNNVPDYQKVLSKAFPNIYVEFGTCPGPNNSVGGLWSNYENDTGIIVSIKNKKTVVFTGDCSFDFIPSSVGMAYADYVVLPHHGGKVIMQNYIQMKPKCVPIVSSGFARLYSGVGYQRQYDQKFFLLQCGVKKPIVFLKTISKSFHEINNV